MPKTSTAKISLGLNPDGPVDRQIGLLRLERPDGSLIALAANYAIHGTVLSGSNTAISGDAPGIVTEYLEKALGATVLFINGAAGNAAPIYSVYPTPSAGHLSEFRVLLGDRILEANRQLTKGSADVTLRLDELTVETALKPGLEWPPELARYSRIEDSGRVLVRLPVRVLRMNDAVIWSAPVELFSEIAIEVRSPFALSPHVSTSATPTAGSATCPPHEAFAEGGYEPQTSPFTGAAEADLTRDSSPPPRRQDGHVLFNAETQERGESAGAALCVLLCVLCGSGSAEHTLRRDVHRCPREILGLSESRASAGPGRARCLGPQPDRRVHSGWPAPEAPHSLRPSRSQSPHPPRHPTI